mmetsp:Transcript_40993/g.101159  ORF Transcript_40993/g.101159 Transcript_40993/m.101159 type:complete len:284 (-) Transcript_40993:231-1082(-)
MINSDVCVFVSYLQALLAKASRPLDPRFAHLRSLKDVTAVTLHADPEYKRESASAAAADAGEEGVLGKAPFHCPVSKLPFNGRHAFYAIRPSGHVVSERALAMTSWKLCPVTETPLQPAPPAPLAGPAGPSEAFPKKRVSADLLLLALDGDELESARRALDDKRAAEPAKPLKAKKRISDKSAAGGSGAGVAPAITDSTATTNAIAKRPRALGIASTAGPSMTLDVSRTVAAARDELAKKAKSGGVYAGLFLPQHVRDAEAKNIREGKDYMTRAIQPGKPKER